MSGEPRKRPWRWLRHVLWVLLVKVVLITAGVIIFFGSGAGNPFLRRVITHRLETMTGGRAESRSFSMRWLQLRATLGGLVIHGREPAGAEPLFAADELQMDLRIDSFWGRKISLADALLRRPRVHLLVDKNGATNLPAPPRQSMSSKPVAERLFDLHLQRIRLEDGWILFNDKRTPLSVKGGALHLAFDAGGTPEHPLYLGTLEWEGMEFAAKRYLPVPAGIALKFTLWRGGFTLEQAVIRFGHSELDAQAELAGFADPQWTFRYRGWVRLEDVRQILRKPMTPGGRVDFRGEGTFAKGQAHLGGGYVAQDIALEYPLFRAKGFSGRGSYRINNDGFESRDLAAQAFGGSVTGSVSLRFADQSFVARTQTSGMSLAGILAAADRTGFPVNALHWDAAVSAKTVATWTADFQHFEIAGATGLDAPAALAPGYLPVAGHADFRYRHHVHRLDFSEAELTTATSRMTASGFLNQNDSSLETHFEAGDLTPWNDFLLAIQGVDPRSAAAVRTGGSLKWDGRVTGPVAGPSFLGHARGERVPYGPAVWDLIEGDIVFSPTELSLSRARARHGAMNAELSATLGLTDWRFLERSHWTSDASLDETPLEEVQGILGLAYPLHGRVSGQFHGRGTRAEPSISGLFDLADAEIYGVSIHRLRGQMNWTPESIGVVNAEMRLFPPEKEGGHGAGIITGAANYRFADRGISLDLVGASLPLENIQKLQGARLPVGGQLSFRLKAEGPFLSPSADGTFRVVDLRVRQEVIGSFEGRLSSDGREARLDLSSAMAAGQLTGALRVALRDDFPLTGRLQAKEINLDPFIQTALRLPQFTGRGSVEGEFELSGLLARPQSLAIHANLTRLVLNYANVRLENAGPVRFHSSAEELRIEQATFRGTDTNLDVAGSVRFTGARAISLRLNGAWDLRLLTGFVPQLDTRGPAQINADFEGSLDRPRITGRMHVQNATARFRDFPTGISGLTGDLVFDATRLFFENVTAASGGGVLSFAGSVSYADRPLRYDITARTPRLRIRYPEGMSWLAGGALRLTGTTESALLSGRVGIERVTLSKGLEVAGMLVAAQEGISAPATGSTYLRNMQFDIEAVSSPDTRLEWPGAEFQAEANLRVRGTWEHPILLGHIHILSGDLTFAGNRYRVSRGDLNFANPFRLDPVLNVEATTTIQQYEITLNFNGPASKLTLAYRSDPPLPANDIVTLLALGQTGSEAELRSGGIAQGGGSGASALLSQAIASQLGGRLERLFGITRLRVDPGLGGVGTTGSEQNAAARVTVQQQVTRNLTITYITNVTSTQQQVIQVEYNVSRNVSIVALRDQNGTFGLDVKIKKRFK